MSNFRERERSHKNAFWDDPAVEQPILVVEDSAALRQLLCAKLQDKWRCEVHQAASYEEAKDLLKQHRKDYHLAICDLNLPDAPNGEIVDLMHRAQLKSIVITGMFGEDQKRHFSGRGVVDYVLKESLNSYDYVVEQAGRLYFNRFRKVLVVDDSPTDRTFLSLQLELFNFQVLTAASGQEAFMMLDKNPDICLLITDYRMPDVNGLELTVEAREIRNRSDLSIIGLSGENQFDLASQFIKHGANDFLVKPYSLEEMISRINQNIDTLHYIEMINNLANRDYLTSIYNRRHYFTAGKEILAEGGDCAVAIIDIDHFKAVNDGYGHDVGDDVLIAVASQLQDSFKEQLVARLGGEEFAVLFPNVKRDDAIVMLEAYREALSNTPIESGEHSLRVTASIGCTFQNQGSLDAMMKQADEQLYDAKARGRNQTCHD